MNRKGIFQANLENLDKISKFINTICVEAGLDESTTYKVQLSVDEACSNIIEHGYFSSTEENRIIECECKFNGNELTIRLHDYGSPFNPRVLPNPELSPILEERGSGGLGFFFIKQFMDVVEYKYISKSNAGKNMNKYGNYLTLVKRMGI
jgi:serine/threonine-protein kinase RsbW